MQSTESQAIFANMTLLLQVGQWAETEGGSTVA